MPTYGISPTGFYSKPLDVVDTEVDGDVQQILGQSAGTDSSGKVPYQSMAGQLKAMMVDGFSAQWDLLQAVVANLDPQQAVGVFQDVIGALTGTIRNKARQSVATGTLVGDPNTAVPAGRAAIVGGTTSRFTLPTGIILATGVAWSPGGTYGVGDIRYAAKNTYQAMSSGIAGPSGPTGNAGTFVDGTVYWKYLGAGVGIAHAAFLSDAYGPVGVATGGLNTIQSPISGWNAVTNRLAGVLGVTKEADAAFRIRRDQEVATTGNATADAILANILSINQGSTDPNHQPPATAKIFFNFNDAPDVNGLPGHSVEVLVQGGTDQDIAQTVWDSVAAGTATYGNQTSTVTDSEGQSQTVKWSRPNNVPLYVTAVGGYDASQWPANSQGAVAQSMLSAFLTETEAWPIGYDVRYSPLNAAIMTGPAGTTGGVAIVPADASAPPVPGLLEVQQLYFGTGVSPSNMSSLSMGIRDVATFDVSRCVFSAVPETP